MATAADLDKASTQLKASDAAYTAARGKAAAAESRLKELEGYLAQDPNSVSPERIAQQRARVAAANAELTTTGAAYQASTDNWKQVYNDVPAETATPTTPVQSAQTIKTESADAAVAKEAGPQTAEFTPTPAVTTAPATTDNTTVTSENVGGQDPTVSRLTAAQAAEDQEQPNSQQAVTNDDPLAAAAAEAAAANEELRGEQPTEEAVPVGDEDPFEARRLELEQEQNRQALTEQAADVEPGPGTGIGSSGVAYDEDGNLMPGYTLDENGNPVYVGGGFVEPATSNLAEIGRLNAQKQKTLQARQNRASQGDWRVRIHLAPGSNYLYNAPAGKVGGRDLPGPGILAPLAATDGVIFPYTPTIETSYQAKYQNTDLVHSNYRGYFYQSSYVDTVTVRGTFTAQDTKEAQYLLAAIHFFRSATKMFYGQDQQAGTPPPLVFLSGLGQFQFNKHPCVISNFTYTLPNDVDYIRADGFNNYGINLENRRTLSSGPSLGGALGFLANKLGANGLFPGGLRQVPTQGAVTASVTNTTNTNSTYVPTKMEISVQLLPMQTRSQQSQQFSLQAFGNGNLLKGGFW